MLAHPLFYKGSNQAARYCNLLAVSDVLLYTFFEGMLSSSYAIIDEGETQGFCTSKQN